MADLEMINKGCYMQIYFSFVTALFLGINEYLDGGIGPRADGPAQDVAVRLQHGELALRLRLHTAVNCGRGLRGHFAKDIVVSSYIRPWHITEIFVLLLI